MAFQRRKPAAIGVKAPCPGFIEPELATLVEKVSSGKRWIQEIKFDGYRVQVHLRDAAVMVFTRRGHDWTNRFRKDCGRCPWLAPCLAGSAFWNRARFEVVAALRLLI
jgi:bifunctional non-homologous end joining protein LigD